MTAKVRTPINETPPRTAKTIAGTLIFFFGHAVCVVVMDFEGDGGIDGEDGVGDGVGGVPETSIAAV
jgi:hypothetical protein